MEPGDVCRYMAVPWQADFNECASQPIDGRIFWWWPAQRPEFVYLKPERHTSALAREPSPRRGEQVPWIGTDYDQNASNYISFAEDLEMVKRWDQLGFVYNIGSKDKPHFVEVERRLPRPDPPADDWILPGPDCLVRSAGYRWRSRGRCFGGCIVPSGLGAGNFAGPATKRCFSNRRIGCARYFTIAAAARFARRPHRVRSPPVSR
ncbi:MAG: LodA/GoxA family CTQ-dependent oxidase [Deltaproteobacteria bacterium]|nr:LodA/GoxA family CTQ-dependent oxidase [Deltaproteobacteria bacterium]